MRQKVELFLALFVAICTLVATIASLESYLNDPKNESFLYRYFINRGALVNYLMQLTLILGVLLLGKPYLDKIKYKDFFATLKFR